MAALKSTTPVIRHILGDLAARFFTFSAANDGDTFVVPGVSQILDVIITPLNLNAANWTPAASWSGGTVTIHTNAAAMPCTVLVLSRVG